MEIKTKTYQSWVEKIPTGSNNTYLMGLSPFIIEIQGVS